MWCLRKSLQSAVTFKRSTLPFSSNLAPETLFFSSKCFFSGHATQANEKEDPTFLAYKRKLLYRSNHRGMRENDLILGSFAKEHLNDLSREELREYEKVLDQPDPELFSWFTGKATPPPEFKDHPILLRLCSYTHSFKQPPPKQTQQ
eukprot:TRINITY_DN15003_c0_g1_i1.p1 TRINITY_DN15003_c0_g1~~TRINITY_DN15003_c0_g1_i1.p1  ORF type:complete len:165 (+),score=41.57 TRINITY_DN15003_c0_g1_i1:55-495(+)